LEVRLLRDNSRLRKRRAESQEGGAGVEEETEQENTRWLAWARVTVMFDQE
jgi:hypothetical protein